MKKYVYWGIFVLFVMGSILTGGPFNLIDIIVVRPIVNILFVIFNLVHDFGLAIIIFTVLVKLCMWPLTKRQLNQTKLIRKIQPELTQIRKNCKGNKQLESLQTMDLYKRYNVKPFASIITLIIQLPIFIAIFSAIRVIATPLPQDNLNNRAYDIVAYEGSEIKTLEEKQQVYLADLTNSDIPAEEKTAYDFYPQLFGVIRLDVRASDVLSGRFSWSAFFILVCAILASVIQYFATKQQMPSGKSENKKKFRDLIKEAKAGKEIDESDVSSMTTSQMSMIMPLMMFFIMFNLNVKASDVLMGKFSWSALFILVCAVMASVVQYWATKQQMPSGKSEKKKKFREILKEAKDGKEIDNADISSMTTGQMSMMMPIMMFIIMFNLNGALAFYYFLSNIITVIQQRIVLKKVDVEIDATTDKAVLKELRNIKEAEVVKNKKTGTKITRVSAKDIKKKRR